MCGGDCIRWLASLKQVLKHLFKLPHTFANLLWWSGNLQYRADYRNQDVVELYFLKFRLFPVPLLFMIHVTSLIMFSDVHERFEDLFWFFVVDSNWLKKESHSYVWLPGSSLASDQMLYSFSLLTWSQSISTFRFTSHSEMDWKFWERAWVKQAGISSFKLLRSLGEQVFWLLT